MVDHPDFATSSPPPDADTPTEPARPPAPARFWLASAVGVIIALPIGCAMSYIAPLLYLLGLFFFLVVGLLLGAVLYRLALPAAPIPRPRLYLLASVVAAVLWSGSLATEYLTFPGTAVKAVRKNISMPLTPDRRQAIDAAVRSAIAAKLKTEYRPGGLLGYFRWAATDGSMQVPRAIDSTHIRVKLAQARVQWIVRVVLSLVFTAGAILSQILPLVHAHGRAPEPLTTESTEA
jgi:hypothetical protein